MHVVSIVEYVNLILEFKIENRQCNKLRSFMHKRPTYCVCPFHIPRGFDSISDECQIDANDTRRSEIARAWIEHMPVQRKRPRRGHCHPQCNSILNIARVQRPFTSCTFMTAWRISDWDTLRGEVPVSYDYYGMPGAKRFVFANRARKKRGRSIFFICFFYYETIRCFMGLFISTSFFCFNLTIFYLLHVI